GWCSLDRHHHHRRRNLSLCWACGELMRRGQRVRAPTGATRHAGERTRRREPASLRGWRGCT
ncbi:unnamed protein product, partial [Musa hybrid cultivar]